MTDPWAAYRDALVAHHRRTSARGMVFAFVGLPLWWSWRLRLALRHRDPLGVAAFVVALAAGVVRGIGRYRRAERAADERVAREQANQQRRAARQQQHDGTVAAASRPAALEREEREAFLGCLAMLVLFGGGFVAAAVNYRRRPGPGAPPGGPWWRPRPAPAWWTGLSWQRLPVNATSRAPRAAQIRYERRQNLTLGVPGTAAQVFAGWSQDLRPALAERDRVLIAAFALQQVSAALGLVDNHRRVPRKVDAQRARRDRHARAVTDLQREIAAGRPAPPNPWPADTATAVAIAAFVTAWLIEAVRGWNRRPRPPTPPTPPPPPRRRRPPRHQSRAA